MAFAKKRYGLYVLDNQPISSSLVSSRTSGSSSSSHSIVIDSKLVLLDNHLGDSFLSMVMHIPCCKNVQKHYFFCDACKLGKLHWVSFDRSSTHVFALFELVHVDLWRPYKILDITRAHYFFHFS